MARSPEFDLAKELAKPSFTPGARDAGALVELIIGGEEPATTKAAPALAGLRDVARTAIVTRLESPVEDGGAARLISVLGLLARAGDSAARDVLLAKILDSATRVRRAAIVALGKLAATGGKDTPVELREGDRRADADRRAAPGEPVVELRATARRNEGDRRDELDDVRAALLTRWDAADVTPDERRALAEALGKVGGEAAMARLQALDPSADKELERRRDRAVLIADRTAKRGEDSTIRTDVAPARPLDVRLGCRPGLGELLYGEILKLDLGGVVRTQQRTDAVDVTLAKPWSALFASRLWATASIRVPLPDLPPAQAIVQTVTSPQVRELLRAWTTGPIRWRLAMAKGHQRAVVWTVAKEVTRLAPELINDCPTCRVTEGISCNTRHGNSHRSRLALLHG